MLREHADAAVERAQGEDGVDGCRRHLHRDLTQAVAPRAQRGHVAAAVVVEDLRQRLARQRRQRGQRSEIAKAATGMKAQRRQRVGREQRQAFAVDEQRPRGRGRRTRWRPLRSARRGVQRCWHRRRCRVNAADKPPKPAPITTTSTRSTGPSLLWTGAAIMPAWMPPSMTAMHEQRGLQQATSAVAEDHHAAPAGRAGFVASATTPKRFFQGS